MPPLPERDFGHQRSVGLELTIHRQIRSAGVDNAHGLTNRSTRSCSAELLVENESCATRGHASRNLRAFSAVAKTISAKSCAEGSGTPRNRRTACPVGAESAGSEGGRTTKKKLDTSFLPGARPIERRTARIVSGRAIAGGFARFRCDGCGLDRPGDSTDTASSRPANRGPPARPHAPHRFPWGQTSSTSTTTSPPRDSRPAHRRSATPVAAWGHACPLGCRRIVGVSSAAGVDSGRAEINHLLRGVRFRLLRYCRHPITNGSWKD